MKAVEERWRPGECTPVNIILLQVADSPCWIPNHLFQAGVWAVPMTTFLQDTEPLPVSHDKALECPTVYQDMQAGQWLLGCLRKPSDLKVFVCHFRSGRLKFKQLSMKEMIEARVRKQRLQNLPIQLCWQKVWSSALTSSEVGCLAVVTAKVSLNAPVCYENSAGLFVLMLSTPVLANTLKRLGFKTDSGLYFVPFVGDTSLEVQTLFLCISVSYQCLIYIFRLYMKTPGSEH